MTRLLVAAVAVAFVPGATARAQIGTTLVAPIVISQSAAELAARAALMQTPVAGLPPIATSTIEGEVQKSPVYSVRYGYLSGANDFSFNNAAVSATLPITIGSSLTFSGGVANCNGCGTGVMAGIGGDVRLHGIPLHYGGDGARILFALSGSLGYGWSEGTAISEGSVFSAALALPVSLISVSSTNPNAWHFVPFVAPGFGVGYVAGQETIRRVGPAGVLDTVSQSASGARLTIGGGISVFRRSSNWALNFGAQYVLTEASNILVGLGLNFGGR